MKFDLLPSGDTATASVVQGSLHTDLGGGVYASLVTVMLSAASENVARATTRDLRELKHKELRSLRELSDVALKAAPEKLRHATEAWLAMSEEQQEVAESSQGKAK